MTGFGSSLKAFPDRRDTFRIFGNEAEPSFLLNRAIAAIELKVYR